MNLLSVALTVLSLSATQLASIARPRTGPGHDNGRENKWSQSDMETWEEFGRWRRAHPRHDNKEYDGERDRRWNDDRDRRGRDRDHGNDHRERKERNDRKERDYPTERNDRNDRDYPNDSKNRKPYPPSVMPPAIPEPVLNPLPIIIEPIRPMPSIIEPYPVIETTGANVYPVISTSEYYSSYYSQTVDYYSSSEKYSAPTSTANYYSSSSVYYPSSSSSAAAVTNTYSSKVAVVSKKYSAASNTTSTSMDYGFTSIVTVPESTVTTKVTGRYRAMSNSAAGTGNSVAGTISFGLVLFSSLFLLIIV